MPRNTNMLRVLAIASVALLLLVVAPLADEYIIGPEDVLEISFWQNPDLNQTTTVRQDGKITLSIIGEITAAGLSSEDLSDQIARNVSLYDKSISQATVTVTGFHSQKIFMAGQVINPGKYTFEVIPDVWTIIKEAGGVTEQGDLTRVAVIKSRDIGGEIITVNVLEAIATGALDRLPKLESGNTIEVPRTAGGLPGRQLSSDFTERKNLFYVLGPVTAPGSHSYEGEMDILDAIGAAGGITERANLKDVQVITKNGNGTTVLKANLEEYRREGQVRRITIKPEDTIIIGQRGRSILSWENIRDLTAITTSLVTLYLIIDRERATTN